MVRVSALDCLIWRVRVCVCVCRCKNHGVLHTFRNGLLQTRHSKSNYQVCCANSRVSSTLELTTFCSCCRSSPSHPPLASASVSSRPPLTARPPHKVRSHPIHIDTISQGVSLHANPNIEAQLAVLEWYLCTLRSVVGYIHTVVLCCYRHQLFMQVRKDIVENRLKCSSVSTTQLSGLVAQGESHSMHLALWGALL